MLKGVIGHFFRDCVKQFCDVLHREVFESLGQSFKESVVRSRFFVTFEIVLKLKISFRKLGYTEGEVDRAFISK